MACAQTVKRAVVPPIKNGQSEIVSGARRTIKNGESKTGSGFRRSRRCIGKKIGKNLPKIKETGNKTTQKKLPKLTESGRKTTQKNTGRKVNVAGLRKLWWARFLFPKKKLPRYTLHRVSTADQRVGLRWIMSFRCQGVAGIPLET